MWLECTSESWITVDITKRNRKTIQHTGTAHRKCTLPKLRSCASINAIQRSSREPLSSKSRKKTRASEANNWEKMNLYEYIISIFLYIYTRAVCFAAVELLREWSKHYRHFYCSAHHNHDLSTKCRRLESRDLIYMLHIAYKGYYLLYQKVHVKL